MEEKVILLHSLQLTVYRPTIRSRKSHQVPACMTFPGLLSPALAEEVIFSVASVCQCVCLSVHPFVLYKLDRWTYRGPSKSLAPGLISNRKQLSCLSLTGLEISNHMNLSSTDCCTATCVLFIMAKTWAILAVERTLHHRIGLKAILKIPS